MVIIKVRCTVPRNLQYLLVYLLFKPNYIFTKSEIQDKYMQRQLKRGRERGMSPPLGKIRGA